MTAAAPNPPSQSPAPKPWWREPWPWLLMAGPAAALVACIVTITLALQGYSAQAIHDGGRKQGLVVSKPESKPVPAAAPATQHATTLAN